MKLNSPKQRLNTKEVLVKSVNLQGARIRILELHYIFFTNFCKVNKFQELEMVTVSLYVDFTDEEMQNSSQPEMKTGWRQFRSQDCKDIFSADLVTKFIFRTCCVRYKKKRDSLLFSKKFSEKR